MGAMLAALIVACVSIPRPDDKRQYVNLGGARDDDRGATGRCSGVSPREAHPVSLDGRARCTIHVVRYSISRTDKPSAVLRAVRLPYRRTDSHAVSRLVLGRLHRGKHYLWLQHRDRQAGRLAFL